MLLVGTTSIESAYYPPADAPYAAPQDAWVPLLSTIVDAANLTNHTFVNLTFSHATWRQPSTADGYVPTQSAVTPSGEPVGAVRPAGRAAWEPHGRDLCCQPPRSRSA